MKRYYYRKNHKSFGKKQIMRYELFNIEFERYLYYIEGDRVINPNGIFIGYIYNNPMLEKALNQFKLKERLKERLDKLNKI